MQQQSFPEIDGTIKELREQLRGINDKVLQSVLESRIGQLELMVGQFVSASYPGALAYTAKQLLEMSDAARGEVMAAAAAQKRAEAAGEELRKKGAGVDWPADYAPTATQMLSMRYQKRDDTRWIAPADIARGAQKG
jgi:hypothetical protein